MLKQPHMKVMTIFYSGFFFRRGVFKFLGSVAPLDESLTNDHHQRHWSRLEWAESSWTRLLHVLCWWWVNPILSLGYKRTLTENDLDDLPHIDKSSVLLDRLHSYDWTLTTTWDIIIKEFWKDYILASFFFLPYLIVCLAQPLLFRQIVLSIMNEEESNVVTYSYVIGLFICAIIQTLSHRQNIFRSVRVGIRIRNALTLIIYTRSLTLKSTSWQQMNTSRIINLIASDASKFEEACKYLGYLWEGPVEAIVIFFLLCRILHPIPVICGYSLFPLFALVQVYFSRKFGEYREKTALCSDKRVHAFNEFIHGCYVVKVYNWEKPMEDRIRQLRRDELTSIQHTSRFRALNMTQFFISTPLLALMTFGSAWILDYPLNAADTFTALCFFAMMRVNIMCFLPMAIEKLSEAWAASKRIDSFMRLTITEEHQSQLNTTINQQQKGCIVLSDASFSWHDEKYCLLSLNLIIQPGTLVGIVGPVGSGKSSLLSAILGEMNLCNGQLNTNNSSFSYVAQSSWIFADTLRNNILLNRPYDEHRYRNVIYACCLDVDLGLFGSSGDLTVIGERGVNLSGGQKARVSLARAMYTNADIYLFDDPFASVDRTVAKQIYDRCIGPYGLLKKKTRLLVTHQTQFLNESHQIIYLAHGHIDEHVRFNENIIREGDANKNEPSVLSSMLDEHISIVDTQPIIADETSLTGGVSWPIWCRLFTAPPLGRLALCLLIVLLLMGEILYDGANYWLSLWLTKSSTDQKSSENFAYIYFGLIVATVFVDLVRTNYYFMVILNGSNNLHNNMLKGLLYTPIQFFESNPSGRILNRASKDQQIIDEVLPITLLDGVITLLMAIGSMAVICFINPSALLLLIILVPFFWLIMRFYSQSCRQLKRLESVTRSPVYALFSSSLDGLATIRALKAKDSFIQSFSERIDANTCAYTIVQAASQWLSVRLNGICWLILLAISIKIVFFRDQMDSSTAALSMMSAMYVSLWFQWAVRQLSDADILMTSVERVDEYSKLPREENYADHKRLMKTSPEWPSHGTIEFRYYSLRHRFNLEYAIRNINLRIESGQKIGIIGRTGAGKSSLFKGIFRFVHRSNVTGEILIDNIDISHVTLNHLRSNLSVIPQEPVLFSGTLRYNLDPFNHYSDEQCWMALEDVQLKQFVSNHPTGLLMLITASGNNLSIGQCQLICIARAILKKSKILLIDEATANVDQKTDELIQTVIANKFQDRTILTIAHRLNTMIKSDHIVVLDKGMVVNYDTPMNILQHYQ